MTVWQQLSKWINRSNPPTYRYWVYARCNRCGETVKACVDLRNDLSLDYGEDGEADRYFSHKSLVGSGRCFERLEVELIFNVKRELISRTITGGEFITPDELQESLQD